MDTETFPSCLYLDEDMSDVRLIVENEKTKWNFPAHTLVLKKKSPVLRKMLEGDFAESKNRFIFITDFKACHVQHFLKYLYTDALPESYASLCELLKLSDKYMVTKLTNDCEQALLEFVNLQNVFQLCHLAELYSLEKLLKKCLALIKRAALFKLLKCDELECLSKELMVDIVRADDLNVSNEMEVFWAIWRWGNMKIRSEGSEVTNENVASFVEDLLKDIRWNLLKKEDKDKIISLGVTVDELVLQKTNQFRRQLPTSTPSFLYNIYDLCTVLQLDHFASCTFLENAFPDNNEWCLMRFVSSSYTPFYVVGVRLVCTTIRNIQFCGGRVTCKCGPVSSFATYPPKVLKDYKIGSATYDDAVCEFAQPIPVGKNNSVIIHVHFSPNNSYCQHPPRPPSNCLRLELKENVVKSGGKSIFVEGIVYGITQLFLL